MNSIEEKIKKIISENVNLEMPMEEVMFDTSLMDIGINSLNYIKTIVAIEDEFNIEFCDKDLNINDEATFEDLLNYIQDKIKE